MNMYRFEKRACWKCPDCGHVWLDYGLITQCIICKSGNIMAGWDDEDDTKYARMERKKPQERGGQKPSV